MYGSSAVDLSYQGNSEDYRTLVTELKGKERTPGMVAGHQPLVLGASKPGTLFSRILERSFPNHNLLLFRPKL